VLDEPTHTRRPVALRAQVRQHRAVEPLGREDVDVVDGRELLDRERLGRPEHHVPRVVDDDVDPAGRGEDRGDGGVDRVLRGDVQLDRAEVDLVVVRVVGRLGDGRGVAVAGRAHARVDGVAVVGQGPRGHRAEAARRAADDDRLGHAMPPLAYRIWALIHRAGPAR
jgi:hypothetical protein